MTVIYFNRPQMVEGGGTNWMQSKLVSVFVNFVEKRHKEKCLGPLDAANLL